MIIKFSQIILCANRRTGVRFCASQYVIPLCAIINRRVSASKTDEEIELPQNAGVRVTRILDARVCSGNLADSLAKQDPSCVLT